MSLIFHSKPHIVDINSFKTKRALRSCRVKEGSRSISEKKTKEIQCLKYRIMDVKLKRNNHLNPGLK